MEDLYSFNWASIPNAPYMIKYVVQNSRYNILVSDMTYIYGEELTNTDVQARFCELNPFAEMKSDVLLQRINNSLVQFLNAENECHQMKWKPDRVVLVLNISTGLQNCTYEIRMNVLPANQMLHFIIGPTILGACLSQRKVKELEKKISFADSIGSSSNITPSSSQPLDWFGGEVSPQDYIKLFVELQSHFNELVNENMKLYSLLKEENMSGKSDPKPKMLKSEKEITYLPCVEYEDRGVLSTKTEKNHDIQGSISDETSVPAPKRTKKKKEIKF